MVPQLDVSHWTSQIIWLVICLVILAFFFKKVFLPRIMSSLSARDEHINKLKNTVSSLTKSYETFTKRLTDIDEQKVKETQKILNETKIKCEKILDEQIKLIELRSKSAIKETRKSADELLKNLDRTIKSEIDDATKLVVDKLFGNK